MADRKVVLVTGAGSGIGEATARRLARNGYAVGLLSRTRDELEAVAQAIRAEGGTAQVLPADTSEDEAMRDRVAELVSAQGRLDAVVANAGINGVWAPIEEIRPEEWDKTMQVNLRGTFLTLRHTVPLLKRAGGGAIAVVSSINGNRTFTTPGATAYSATKAAQVAMVKQLALELGDDHIRINAVCPGAIESEISDNTRQRNADEAAVPVDFPEGDIPLTGGKPGAAATVADVIAFLLSPDARHVTGTEIYVDGGQSLLR